LFQTMQQRVEAARTDPVSVPRQFFDHSQTEDLAFDSVVQHMKANQARVQIPVGKVISGRICF